MWYRIDQATDFVHRAVNGLDTNQWLVISGLALVLGMLFLRGFGSRTNY